MSFIRENIIKRFTRSKGWRKVRNAYIKANPFCAVCGKRRGLECHHIVDFSTDPGMELEPGNLITLCRKRRCHILFGHLNNYKSINPNVLTDTKFWSSKIQHRR